MIKLTNIPWIIHAEEWHFISIKGKGKEVINSWTFFVISHQRYSRIPQGSGHAKFLPHASKNCIRDGIANKLLIVLIAGFIQSPLQRHCKNNPQKCQKRDNETNARNPVVICASGTVNWLTIYFFIVQLLWICGPWF